MSEQYLGCSCGEQCTAETCSCLQNFGSAYNNNGQLKDSYVALQKSLPILECGDDCSCNRQLCTNRVVQKGAYAKFSVYDSGAKGFGLKILENIQRFSFVCEYAGEIVDRSEAKRRLQHCDSTGESNYLISIKEHVPDGELCTFVDPRRVGNLGRFINHSCNPNLVMLPVRVNHSVPRLALFSRRDLEEGEELTFDYSGSATFLSESDQNCDSSKTENCCECHNTLDVTIVRKKSAHTLEKNDRRRKGNKSCQKMKCEIHGIRKTLSNTGRVGCSKVKRNSRISQSSSIYSPKSNDFHPNKAGRPCFCCSENCLQFLPFDTI